jgi:polyisoprenoid-binding protein YceI
MATRNTLAPAVLAVLALLSHNASWALDEQELCAPFRNSSVDQSLVDMMLAAAEQGGLYRIRSSTSSVGFCAHSAVGQVEGQFNTFQGGVSLLGNSGPSDGQALMRVDASSLSTPGSLLGILLKGESFFDVENFPEILFVSSGLHWNSDTRGVLEGQLTLRGVTRPVQFRVELVESDQASVSRNDTVQVKATTTIRPSEFGMQPVPKLAEDAVDLCMQVEAVRYAS